MDIGLTIGVLAPLGQTVRHIGGSVCDLTWETEREPEIRVGISVESKHTLVISRSEPR